MKWQVDVAVRCCCCCVAAVQLPLPAEFVADNFLLAPAVHVAV